ncbi:MAG: choice-of-anchor D domain-containing protein [Desulfobacteraceae bacterium]|nr:choice-of-anchor D domain-containing protein [Desulfobacteraceae bacterium]
MALKSDGTVWVWGRNNHGQEGNGSKAKTQLVPQQITSLANVKAIAARGNHCLAVTDDGKVWGWGRNDSGQLGADARKTQRTPVIIPGLSDIVSLSAGEQHNTALKSDGTVWTWGRNNQGQLGNGTNTDSETPVQVKNITDIKAVIAGDDHNLAVKNDGTVWTWGDNDNGQLGNGDDSKTDCNLPVEVKGLIVNSSSASKAAKYEFGEQVIGTTSDEVTFDLCNTGTADLVLDGTPKVSFLKRTGISVMQFDGVGSHVNLGRKPEFKIERDLSIEAWINPTQDKKWATILGNIFDTGTAKESGYGLSLSGSGGLLFAVETPSQGNMPQYYSKGPIKLNSWQHVAVTYDGHQIRMYINGNETGTYDLVVPKLDYNPENDLRIGLFKDDNERYGFKGRMSEVRLWDIARTQKEIQATMYQHLTGTKPNLIGCWSLDQIQDDTTEDKTGKFDGEIHSTTIVTDNSLSELNEPFIITNQPDSPLPEGKCTTFTMAFNPKKLGSQQAEVVVPSNDPDDNPLTFAVNGIGTPIEIPKPKLVIEPEPLIGDILDFGEQHVETEKSLSFTLKNQSNKILRLTGKIENLLGNNAFRIVSLPESIPANGSDTFTISFKPMSGGNKSATLNLTTNLSDDPFVFTLKGKGVGVEIAIRQDQTDIPSTGWSHDFGEVKESDTSPTLTFIIENRGAEVLNLTDTPPVSVTGDDADSFMVVSQPASTIAPGSSSTFSLCFKPSGPDSKKASVSIASNDVDENPYLIEMNGMGMAKCNVQKGHLLTADSYGNTCVGLIHGGTRYRMGLDMRCKNTQGMQNVVALGQNSYSVKADGTLWRGFLPAQKIEGISDVALVDSCKTHTLFLKKDGTVWSLTGVKSAQIPNLSNVVNIAVGSGFSVALKEDGTVWTWGNAEWGELGDGLKYSSSSTPAQVRNLTGVTYIVAGDSANSSLNSRGNPAFAVRNDGTVWAWGQGSFGGQVTYRSTPQTISGLSNIKMVALGSAGGYLALSNSGSVRGVAKRCPFQNRLK